MALARLHQPNSIVLLIADSLRWDAVHVGGNHRLPYLSTHGVCFHQARSAGCWTLPATASLFTGLTPHEHRATSQTRGLRPDVPTLAERMKALGYTPHMISANVVTTHIFGLHRGFDTINRVWQHRSTHYRRLYDLLVLAGKPRLRRKLCSIDFVLGKLSHELEAATVWLQSTIDLVLDHARRLLHTAWERKQHVFCFLNLMETHFPYHIADIFKTSADNLWGRIRELYSLYHLVNQTWLMRDKRYIPPDMLELLRQRQRLAWERIAPRVDAFIREARERYGALIVFGSDHGDNFGEQGWLYHFSNVTDAGTRVPLFWLPYDHDDARSIHIPISTRDLFGTLLRTAGDRDAALFSLIDEPERSIPIMQAYWYNNRGRTRKHFQYNQFAFVSAEQRFVHRRNQWYAAPITHATEPEASFQPLGSQVDPLQEGIDKPLRTYVRQSFDAYKGFSAQL